MVKENQAVKQGDAIAYIDNSQLQTKKANSSASIENDQRQLTQIAAQLSSVREQRESESSLMNRTIASAQADLGRNQRDYRDRLITTQTSTLATLNKERDELIQRQVEIQNQREPRCERTLTNWD